MHNHPTNLSLPASARTLWTWHLPRLHRSSEDAVAANAKMRSAGVAAIRADSTGQPSKLSHAPRDSTRQGGISRAFLQDLDSLAMGGVFSSFVGNDFELIADAAFSQFWNPDVDSSTALAQCVLHGLTTALAQRRISRTN